VIEDPDLRQHFAAESEEHLDAIERLLGTPGAATDRAAVDTLFRAFHSLKGMSGALGVAGMLAVAHRCEDILGLARQGNTTVQGPAADALIAAVDLLRLQRAAVLDDAADVPAP
jgi:two-component system chemotaxis sensor kinase CheA